MHGVYRDRKDLERPTKGWRQQPGPPEGITCCAWSFFAGIVRRDQLTCTRDLETPSAHSSEQASPNSWCGCQVREGKNQWQGLEAHPAVTSLLSQQTPHCSCSHISIKVLLSGSRGTQIQKTRPGLKQSASMRINRNHLESGKENYFSHSVRLRDGCFVLFCF